MPVGYNIAGNTYIPDPLTATKGRALRSGIKSQELARDMAPQELELGQAQEERLRDAQDLAMKKFLKDSDAESREYMENASVAALERYDAGKPEEAADAFRASLPQDEENKLPDDFQPEEGDLRAFIANADEYRLRERNQTGVGYAAKDTYVGEDGKEYHMWYDDVGEAHKTNILAKTETGEVTDFEPPNNQEIEAAEALVKADDELSDLNKTEERIAAQLIATEIRQLLVLGIDPADAAAMAVAKVKRKIRVEPGFLFGKKSTLDLGAGGGLADNEFLGQDGNVYVETEDGFRRKN